MADFDKTQVLFAAAFAMAILLLTVSGVRSFRNREVEFGGGKATPYLLASRLTFGGGLMFYLLFLMLAYAIVTFDWGPVRVLVAPYLKDTPLAHLVRTDDSVDPSLVPLVAGLGIAWALTWDVKYNPFRLMLEAALDMSRVPGRATAVLGSLRATSFGRLAPEFATAIAADDSILSCDARHFEAPKSDLLYVGHISATCDSICCATCAATRVASAGKRYWATPG